MLEKSGILKKLKKGKLAIFDKGYIEKSNGHKLSWPNSHDSKAVNNYKSRTRMRRETFNGGLKNFAICSNTFRHSEAKHTIAFLAVLVTDRPIPNGQWQSYFFCLVSLNNTSTRRFII